MTTKRVPTDIEDSLQAYVNESGTASCALPLPESYDLPHVLVRANGGTMSSFAATTRSVTLECRAKTWAAATELAHNMCALMICLPGSELGGLPVYDVGCTSMPYADPDPDRPDVPRVSTGWSVSIRLEN